MGCARWTYEPEEAVLKSAPRMDWVERLLFLSAENETADSQTTSNLWRSAMMMVVGMTAVENGGVNDSYFTNYSYI